MTVIFGIPIPSQDPAFLGIVALHVLAGLTAVVSGALAMRLQKGRGRHSRMGTIYFWSLAALFVTATALSAMRWSEDAHLFALGALALAFAIAARLAACRHWPLRIHAGGMGASFIAMLTAFYVDNGANLPLWRDLPLIAYWTVPALLGVPIILWVFARHPLLRARPAPT
ncbi:MAG: DUF2306 domain-containing protein [Alphaproteobacteria bacterium]|nr:DUF2306 domain-containing protein [Alphaproteobacteria bacterium]MBL6937848.1 DUF2306 domain-containing protein [Alphaproteobacteria bacterium]MBL7099326.1 DUF2306 domain-containing protein [Alphaproteobacteria bacterium]